MTTSPPQMPGGLFYFALDWAVLVMYKLTITMEESIWR